jgi:hypothetical protein
MTNTVMMTTAKDRPIFFGMGKDENMAIPDIAGRHARDFHRD